MEFAGGGLTGCLGLQAHVTGRDILADVSRHLRPPVVPGHQLYPSRVSGNFGVVLSSGLSTEKQNDWKDR